MNRISPDPSTAPLEGCDATGAVGVIEAPQLFRAHRVDPIEMYVVVLPGDRHVLLYDVPAD